MAVNGIVLYNIELDGCLNGVYTNDNANGEIYNEIAKKIQNNGPEKDSSIPGNYDCFYFSENPRRNNVTLTIELVEGTNVYLFEWEGAKIRHRGIGYRMNARQIAVHYSDVTP